MLAASEVTFSTMPQASKFDRMIHLDANMDEVKRLCNSVLMMKDGIYVMLALKMIFLQ